MTGYRGNLPQMKRDAFLTDGGLETTLVFQRSIELPRFTAFVLLDTAKGRQEFTLSCEMRASPRRR